MEDEDLNGSESNAGSRSPGAPDEVDAFMRAQTSPAAAHIRRMRKKHPNLKPAGILKKLDRQLLASATSTGAALGASAAAPGVGKAAMAAISLGEPAVSLSAAVFYVLAVAEVHQLPAADIEHRRKLALAILVGGGANTAIPKVAERTGQHWARNTLKRIPGEALKPLNSVFGNNFFTKSGDKQGIVVLAVVLPYLFGATLGGGYSFVTTWSLIGTSKLAFGKPKPEFDDDGDVLEEASIDDA
ncbi:hypothetical protein [Arthrobacter bussei]|uniref:Uncharacterized protein n=1 Tax=Arthrobacter bussei TaxID=2594179 RepID=A0A7X1NQI1_9MICC|nr:hypothetical protein [Arthrobacter bussei]MPY11176.1 hypothetical protein [Arthrobacter bussei]